MIIDVSEASISLSAIELAETEKGRAVLEALPGFLVNVSSLDCARTRAVLVLIAGYNNGYPNTVGDAIQEASRWAD